MKKPIIHAPLYRKADRYEPHRCIVEKAVTISHSEFEQMRHHPVQDSRYVGRYKDLMYYADNADHCVLFIDEDSGDVIEVCSGDQKGFYFCDDFGFRQIDFDIGQTDHDKMLRALIVECGKEPYVGEIQDCLKAKQSVVGGLIEPIYFDQTDRALVYCDEEFLLKGCEPNRYVGDCLVHSTFMVIGNGQNEYGEGIEVSLTDEQIEKYAEQFRYPVIYDPSHSAEQTEEETEDFSFSQA